ncbi:MAG: hypothetical protein WBM04_03675 [Candidatus Korobacteraceae bacterium]
MKRSLSLFLPFVVLAATASLVAGNKPEPQHENHSSDFRAMEKKIAYLKQNAARSHPDPRPTEITEAEANAYFNEGGVKLPKGVSHVRLAAGPGSIDGHAQVDFEALTQGKTSANPLLGLFSGTHDIHVIAQAGGSNGNASIHAQSVALDGIEVPQMLLQLFVQHFLTPKYPNVGITSTFKLPLRIDSAVVESGRVRLAQK